MIPKIVMPNSPAALPKLPTASPAERMYAGKAADALLNSNGFRWDLTVEGSKFWESVYVRLTQISTDGILKEIA